MTEIPNHVIRPAIEVMFENQPKTFPDPELIPMYARVEKRAQNMMETCGRPFFEVVRKILGALPTIARPYKARELV